MEVITEQRWDNEKVKDYISQFKTKVEFTKSPEYGSIYSFYRRNNDLETLQSLTSGLEGKQKNRDYDYVKNYISQFNTFEEFRDSPEYNAIHTAIYKNYGKETWAELISPLEKEKELRWNLDKVKNYISQFNKLEDLKRSKKGNAIASWIDREYPGKWSELTAHLERDREDWTVDKAKEYISQFKTMYDFENSPKYKKINSWAFRKKEGVPFKGSEIWKEVTSGLKRKIYKGERKVSDILTDLGYEVTPEKKFTDCKSGKETYRCTRLKFDFYTTDKDGKEICVEFDGKQHFEPYEVFGGEKRFQEQVKNDIIKKQYTKDNNIKLIRISYNDYKNIENELKNGLNSQDQLYLSSNYPKLGWNDPSNLTEQKLKKEYIITESQLKTIVESKSAFIEKLRRRFNEMSMQDYIYNAQIGFSDPCEKFDNEAEYAYAIIVRAVENFLFQEELVGNYFSTDWPVRKTEDVMITMCREWFEDDLMEEYQGICQYEFDDEDFDVMSEEYETASDKVIVRLFKLFNEYKKTDKTKKEYIITESQYNLLMESAFIKKLRRRFNEKTMRDFIYHAETEFPNPCEKFDNEFEYADAVINQAVDDFLFQDELWEYFHSGDWPVVKITDMMVTMCKEWFEDGLLGFHQTTCQDEFDDEDFDMMNEDYEIASDKVIVRLFKLFNEYKKTAKTKKELLNIIMEYLPMFGIPKTYAIYMLELYLLNYREDGDYSGLNKDNFIDPRNKSGKKTANYQAGDYTKAQLPFEGSNLRGYWTKDRNGVKYYVVKSYGWYPVYIYKEGKWYENFDRYSNSTSKQMLRSRPYTYNSDIDTNVYLMSKKEMEMLESGFSHEDVMKKKKESFRDVSPSSRLSTAETQGWTGDIPYLKIKFKISSIEDLGDKNAVNVDIYDVFKTENYKQIPTPENYLKGEIPNVTPEKIEKEVERKLRQNFREYLGPMLGNQDEELVTFKFNHLKK